MNFNHWLILKQTKHDPIKFFGRFEIKKAILTVSSGTIFLITILVLPVVVSANIFSSILFNQSSKDSEKNQVDPKNSQNVPILEAVLNHDPKSAQGGGEITIVDNKALLAETGISGSLVEVTEREKSGQISIYEVREGDTVSQIAQMFNVSANTIRWANNLDGPIAPGQTLVILPITGIKHTVKKGGTVADIAKIYNGDAREIAIFNGISVETTLNPGDEILIPNGEMSESAPKKTKTASKSSSVSYGGPSYSGYFIRPLSGGKKSQGIHGHNAVDIAAPVGTPVYASASGVVIVSNGSGWNGGYGTYIVIKHDNGTQTLYSHLATDDVVVGQRVEQGEVIGSVGMTGKTSGPHLHFEVRGAKNPF